MSRISNDLLLDDEELWSVKFTPLVWTDEQTYVGVVSDHGCSPDVRVANMRRNNGKFD